MLDVAENEILTQVVPNSPMGTLLRRYWVPFLLSDELPKPDCPPVRVQLMDEQLVAFRETSGRIGLVQQACPHRRAGLFWGRNEEGGLRCVYHGWKFDVEGNCVDMPSEPEASNFKSKISIVAYPCREAGGVVWAYLGPPEHTPDLPGFEWLSLPADHVHVVKRVERTNWVQGLEGGIDSSHSNFLHTNLDVYRRTPAWQERVKNSPKMRDRYHAWDRSPRFYVHDTDYGMLIGAQRNAEPDTFYWRLTHWAAPFYNLFGQGSGGRVNPGRSIAWSPISRDRTFVFSITWRTDRPLNEQEVDAGEKFVGPAYPGTFNPTGNMENDYLVDRDQQVQETFTGIMGTQWQDLAVQESMGAVGDRSLEHLGISDTAIIRMRRLLLKAAINLREGTEPYPPTHPDVYDLRAGEAVLPREDGFNPEALEALCRPAI